MSAFTKLTKDLKEYDPKMLYGLTKRQLTFTVISVIAGLFTYFISKIFVSSSTSLMIMTIVILPIAIIGFIKIDKMGLEKHLFNYIKRKYNSKKRYYRIDNKYLLLNKNLENTRRGLKNLENHEKKKSEFNSKNV